MVDSKPLPTDYHREIEGKELDLLTIFFLVYIGDERAWKYIAHLLFTCVVLSLCLREQLLLLNDMLSDESSESPPTAAEPEN